MATAVSIATITVMMISNRIENCNRCGLTRRLGLAAGHVFNFRYPLEIILAKWDGLLSSEFHSSTLVQKVSVCQINVPVN